VVFRREVLDCQCWRDLVGEPVPQNTATNAGALRRRAPGVSFGGQLQALESGQREFPPLHPSGSVAGQTPRHVERKGVQTVDSFLYMRVGFGGEAGLRIPGSPVACSKPGTGFPEARTAVMASPPPMTFLYDGDRFVVFSRWETDV